jgi:hypothetical protein
MKCNWRGVINTWKGESENCPDPIAAKCKVCNQGTCAEHKGSLGCISPGVQIDVCYKCREQGNKMYRVSNLDVIKKVPNLCCVLDPSMFCACSNWTCERCYTHSVKPHNDCDFLRCRRVIKLLKAYK